MDPKQKTMRAVYIDDWNQPAYVKEIPIPEPKPGEILIKVMACSINPADNAFLKGIYASKRKPPTTIGLEGSGIVIKNGGGLLGWLYLGCHVSFFSKDEVQGSWAEYAIVDADKVILQNYDSPFSLTSCGMVNPTTVVMMHEVTIAEGHKAVIVTGACSSVGRMMNSYFTENGIPVVSIVRRQEQKDILKNVDKAKYIICTEDADWQDQLQIIVNKLKPTCMWDVIAGQLTGQVLKVMPPSSICHVFGMLSLKDVQVDAKDLIFKKKKIVGFWSSDIIKQKNLYWKLTKARLVKNKITTVLKPIIAKETTLEEVNEAIKYYKKNMSHGKVVFLPHQKDTKSKQEENRIEVPNKLEMPKL